MTLTATWAVLSPQASVNWIVDPALRAGGESWTGETVVDGSASVPTYRGARVMRGTGTSSAGHRGYQAVAVAASDDVTELTLSAWMFLDQPAGVDVGIEALVGGLSYVGLAAPNLVGRWQRVAVTVPAAAAVTVYALAASGTIAGNVYWDAWQLENGGTLTSYFDGDEGPGCRWSGPMNLSPSVRTTSCRNSGQERSFEDFLSVLATKGAGTPQHSHVHLPRGLQGGSVYQRSLRQARELTIDAVKVAGSDLDSMYNDLGALQRLLSPDLTRPQTQPTLVYRPAKPTGKQLEIDGVLTGGLDYDSMEGLTLKALSLKFLCAEPHFRERGETGRALSPSVTATPGIFMRRPTARGFELPSLAGITGPLYGVRCGTWVGNTLYFAGSPTTGRGLYTFDGETVTPLTAGAGNNRILCLCQPGPESPYLYVGGTFTSFYDGAGSSHGYSYLVRYNMATGVVDRPIVAIAQVTALAYDPGSDTLYVGGTDQGSRIPFAIFSPSAAVPTEGATPWGGFNSGSNPITSMTVDPTGALYLCYASTPTASYPVVRATAHQARTAATQNASTAWSVAKPGGLAVGDLMVLAVYTYLVDTSQVILPSGFVVQTACSSDQGNVVVATKTADDVDVLQSTFAGSVYTTAEGAGFTVNLWDVAHPGALDLVASMATSGTTMMATATGFTPPYANDLLLVCGPDSTSGLIKGVTERNNPFSWVRDYGNASSYPGAGFFTHVTYPWARSTGYVGISYDFNAGGSCAAIAIRTQTTMPGGTANSWVFKGAAGATAWAGIGGYYTPSLTNPQKLLWGPDGCLYLCGSSTMFFPGGYTYGLARYNGAAWAALGGRTQSAALGGTLVTNAGFDLDGRLHLSGNIAGLVPGATASPCGYAIYDGNVLHAEGVVTLATNADLDHTPIAFVSPYDGTVLVVANDSRNPSLAYYAVPTDVPYDGTAPAPVKLYYRASAAATSPTSLGGLKNERTGQLIVFNGLTLSPGELLVVETSPGQGRIYSSARPDLSAYVDGQSALETFVLLPGRNDLSVLDEAGMGGAAWLVYRARHVGIDGAGSALGAPDFEAI